MRFWRRTVALGLLLMALARCGNAAQLPTSAPTAPATQGSPVPSAPRITLTLWHGQNNAVNEILQRLLLDYQRNPAHSNIEIQIEDHGASLLDDYQKAVLAGGPPDIVLLNENRWIGGLADQKLILDLTSRLTESDQAGLQPAALEGARYQGGLYGLPLTLDLPVLYYNRASIVSETPLEDTTRWLELARGLSTDQQQGLAYNLSLYFTQPYLPAWDGRIYNNAGEVVLGTESYTPTLNWLTWVHELSMDTTLLARDDNRLINRAIQQNTALMTIDWARNLPAYRQVWGENVGVQPLPRLSQTGRAAQPLVRSSVLVINPRAAEAHQLAALDVMRFLVGADVQRQLRSQDLPSVRTDLPDDAQHSPIERAAEAGVAWPTDKRFNDSWAALAAMLHNVLNGASIDTVIGDTDRRLRTQ
jgi:maltose-binding protein MalE